MNLKEDKMKVEELSTYGKTFDYVPRKALLLQVKVMFSELTKKFGLFGTAGFLRKVNKKQRQLKKKHGDIMNRKFPDVSALGELYMLAAMFLVIADTEGKEKSYEFVKGILQRIGPTAHEAIYSMKDLKKVEGDIFTNFCKLNRRLFENGARKGLYTVEEIRDSEDLQYVRLTKCLNIDATSTLDVPELGRLGCDIDIAGYAPEALGNKVNLDFRRPCTLANGDKSCEFHYYRKGHAPADMRTI